MDGTHGDKLPDVTNPDIHRKVRSAHFDANPTRRRPGTNSLAQASGLEAFLLLHRGWKPSYFFLDFVTLPFLAALRLERRRLGAAFLALRLERRRLGAAFLAARRLLGAMIEI